MNEERFIKPGWTEHLFNRVLSLLTRFGKSPDYMYMLQVRGRKSGRLFETPVSILDFEGRLLVVAPRGATQWVRNARAAGRVSLRRGKVISHYTITELPDGEKAGILKEYLGRYYKAVQDYFPIPPHADLVDFAELAGNYPVIGLDPAES